MYKKIFQLSFPNIVSNITIPLLTTADMVLMGWTNESANMGAITLGGVVFAYLYWGLGFLRMGVTGFTAQARGARDFRESANLLGRALLVAGLLGAAIIMLQIPIASIGFAVMQGSDGVEALAREYFFIRVWGAPAVLINFVLAGWFLGMQNARFPMMVLLTVNGSNIALDVFFVQILHMGPRGVALGTLLANYAGLGLAFFFLLFYYKKVIRYMQRRGVLQWGAMFRFLQVNRDMFLRTIMILLVFSWMQVKPAELGDNVLAANALLIQMVLMYTFVIDGFAYGTEALVGKAVGSGAGKTLREVLRKVFVLASLCALGFSVVYYGLGEAILRLLTRLPEVRQAAVPYLAWTALMPLVSCAAFIWDGAYIGATASRSMLWSVGISFLFLFLPAYFLCYPLWQLHGLWLAFNLFFVGRSLCQTVMFKKIFVPLQVYH